MKNKLPKEIEQMIKSTFSHFAKKSDDTNYCIHDVMDNCFNSIEEIQFAVRQTVREALTLQSKKKLYVSHGKITHLFGEKCKSCEEVEKEFQKDLKSGEVNRVLALINDEADEVLNFIGSKKN